MPDAGGLRSSSSSPLWVYTCVLHSRGLWEGGTARICQCPFNPNSPLVLFSLFLLCFLLSWSVVPEVCEFCPLSARLTLGYVGFLCCVCYVLTPVAP